MNAARAELVATLMVERYGDMDALDLKRNALPPWPPDRHWGYAGAERTGADRRETWAA